MGGYSAAGCPLVPGGTVTGATDGPDILSLECDPMKTETLEEYMARRVAVRAELTQDSGEDDWLMLYARGKLPRSTFQSMDDIFTDGWFFKRQAE